MIKPPIFYINEEVLDPHGTYVLDEDGCKYLLKVLRKKVGDEVVLTNGKGVFAYSSVLVLQDDKALMKVDHVAQIQPGRKITLGISLLKNIHRWEWMLEKSVELGVTDIVPLWCERTEMKQAPKNLRNEKIVISAMLQSQRSRKVNIKNLVKMKDFLCGNWLGNKYIAHCIEEQKRTPIQSVVKKETDPVTILIGPEGDFTLAEVDLAEQMGYVSLNLMEHRLRTETAAILALSHFV